MSRNHYSHTQPSAPPSPRAPAPAPVPRKRSYVTRYEREIEREQQEGVQVASASTFGENGVIGVWKIGREIGKGASGRVRIARNRQSKMLAAMKVIDKNGPPRESVCSMASSTGAGGAATVGNGEYSDDKIKISIDREVEIMKLIQHPNILQLYDVHESTDCIHLLLEYVGGGELFDRLVNLGRLGADEASQYFQQIISGVSYCHHFNIAHRDLKPENLLIDANNRVKVADFGLAALQQPGRLLQTSCGSPHYASPEIVSGVEYNGAATDIWSCGVVLYALVAGRLPFDDENPRTLLQKVKIGRYHMPADFEPDVKDLISKMLVLDPRRRIKMEDIIKHPFCKRRHPDFPSDSLYLVAPPDIMTMREEMWAKGGLDKSAVKRLMVILPEIREDELIEALFSEEETYAQVCYRLILDYDTRFINNDDPAKYRFFGRNLNKVEKPREMDLAESIFARHPYAFGFGHGYDDYDYGYGFGFGYDLYGDADHLQDHERIGADIEYQHERERTGTSMGRRGDETPRPRRVRIPSPDTDWEVVHKAAAGTPILVDHDRVPSHAQVQTQAEMARALKRRSSHQPATSSRPAAPELHRRSTVIHTHNKETTQERERERERRVNGPRSPMPKTPAMPSHNDHYNTPLRTPQPLRSPQTPGAAWHDYNVTPRPGGLAPPMADVLKWAADVPLPVTPATPGSGFHRPPYNGQGYHGAPNDNNGLASMQRRAESSPRRHAYATAAAPPSPRSHTPTNLVVNRTPGRSKSRDRNSAVVDQEFLEHVQKLTVLNSELESPPFSKLSSSTIRNLDRLGTSTSTSGLPRRRGSPLPIPMPLPLGKGSPGSGPRAGKMPNVFRMMKDKENQPVLGAEPVLRRKRSVFGTNKEKDKDKDKDKENRNSTYGHSTLPVPVHLVDRKPVYASTFATPLDTKFGQNVPGGMDDGNRKPRPAPLNLSVLPKHDLEPSPRLQTPQLSASPADTPMMSQLTTPTIGFHTAPRTPLAVVPEAQAKRNWFEKTFSGRPLGYYELISTYDCSTTREECFKIFTSLGAAVQIEDSENWGNLVITQHEVRGVTGQMITRPVKIKLVFIPRSISSFAPPPTPGSGRASPRPPPSPRSQYSSVRGGGVGGDNGSGTRITFRQEKGGEEGFMAVFEQFRTTWGLDSLRSPGMYGSPAFHSPNLSPINQKGGMEERSHGLFEEDMTGLGMGMYDRTQ